MTPDRALFAQVAPRLPDRCEICGRFVGRYPVGFCCDTHCARCVCRHCPPPYWQARAERIGA